MNRPPFTWEHVPSTLSSTKFGNMIGGCVLQEKKTKERVIDNQLV